MNTDKNRQIHNARKAVLELISKLPEHLKEATHRSSSCARPRRKIPSRWCT